ARGQEAEQGPRSLRGGRRSLACQGRLIIRATGLAPTAARLLHALKPGHRPAYHRLPHVVADTLQAAEHLPGTVDVIHAPAAEPGPNGFLRGLEESDGPIDLLVAHAVAVVSQSLEHARRDVGPV